MIRALAFLLLLGHAAAAAELKIATWNLEWLTTNPAGLPADARPKPQAGIAALRQYALKLGADVIAFEEVDGPAIAAQVFPPDRYRILITADQVTQRVGFAVRRDLPVHQNPDLAALDVQPGARYRLRSGVDITLDLPAGPFRLLGIHLKTGCQRNSLRSGRPACRILAEQVPPLQRWIAERRREGIPFAVLGDFNRVLDPQHGHPDALLAALDAAAPLIPATSGHASPCWGGETFIDHILAGGPARAWMEPVSLRVLVYREHDEASRTNLSDHCPVSIRFSLPAGDDRAAITPAMPQR